jgi:hypothetical protein
VIRGDKLYTLIFTTGSFLVPETLPTAEKMIHSICKLLSSVDKPPRVLVSASATGYYGDRGDEILTEEIPPSSCSNDYLSYVVGIGKKLLKELKNLAFVL